MLHVQPALAPQKPQCNNLNSYCCAGFFGHDQERQRIFGTATFRILGRMHSSPGQKLEQSIFCSKTALPAAPGLEKICTFAQLDWSKSGLPRKQSSHPHPPQHTGGAPQPLRQQPRINVFRSSRGIRNAITRSSPHSCQWPPRSQLCRNLKNAHLDVHRV